MESFVIRIYRRSEGGLPGIVGTLESIATGTRNAFHSQAELVAMLDAGIFNTSAAAPVEAPTHHARGIS